MKFDNFYDLGRHSEIQVCEILQSFGWSTYLSPGSRGPADIYANKESQKWYVQVKYRSNGVIPLPNFEESKLLQYSKNSNAKPILAAVCRYPGGLLLNAYNYRDKINSNVVRDKQGNIFGIEVDKFTALFLFDLITCKKIHP